MQKFKVTTARKIPSQNYELWKIDQKNLKPRYSAHNLSYPAISFHSLAFLIFFAALFNASST